MKLKELLPIISKLTDVELNVVSSKDYMHVVDLEPALTVEDPILLEKYGELKVESFEPSGGYYGDTYLEIYVIGDEEEEE